MKFCSHCQKLVNIQKEIYFWELSKKFSLIVISCSICNSFLFQYLEDKK